MTDKQTLLDLAERVEAGEMPDVKDYYAILKRAGFHPFFTLNPVMTGSLDAAKALHDAVLPGHSFGIDCDCDFHDGGMYRAYVVETSDVIVDGARGKSSRFIKGQSTTPAAAWVAAILRAKANQ